MGKMGIWIRNKQSPQNPIYAELHITSDMIQAIAEIVVKNLEVPPFIPKEVDELPKINKYGLPFGQVPDEIRSK